MKNIFLFLFLLINYSVIGQYTLALPYSGIRIGNVSNPALFTPLLITTPSTAKLEFSGLNPYFTFYENNNFIGYFQTISNTFEIGTKNSADLAFELAGVDAASIEGSTGKLTISNTTAFQGGLRLGGAFKVGNAGNAGTFGQVLRSRGVYDTPIWSDFNYDPQIGFSAIRNTNFTMTNGVNNFISTMAIIFQDTPSTGMSTGGVYTAPNSGFYHFDVNVPYFEWTGNAHGDIGVVILKNGTEVNNCISRFGSFGMGISQDGTKCGFDLKLVGGDTVEFAIYLNSSIPANVNIPSAVLATNQRMTISGYKVY
jgi:hypothetical protein